MAGRAFVRGRVIGRTDEVVAGWVSLGGKGPPRWLGHELRVATDEGVEVVVSSVRADAYLSVDRRRARWRDLEGDELARRLADQAPAPDLEVELVAAVLRGGDPVVAWGEIEAEGPAPTPGQSFRDAPGRVVTRLGAHAIATGGDRERQVGRAVAAHERQAAKATAAADRPPKPSAPARRVVDPDHEDRLGPNIPLYGALAGLALTAIIAWSTWAVALGLFASSAICMVPLALDAAFLPRFREGTTELPDHDIATPLFMFSALGTVLFAFWTATDHSAVGPLPTLVAAIVCACTTARLWLATRSRLKWLEIMVAAPPHPDPLPDGVWGASEGTFSTEVVAVGSEHTWSGTGENATVWSSPVGSVATDGTLTTVHGRTVRVGLARALWISMTSFQRKTGELRGVSKEVIHARTPVRVVGRAQGGALVRGGEGSLLVFASGIGTDVGRALRQLRNRERLSRVMALAGVLCLLAGLALVVLEQVLGLVPLRPSWLS